jgi:exodeoxyribonuclease V alpha subunit
MEEVIGRINNIVFCNKQTGFHVLKVTPDGGALTRVVGTFGGVNLASGLKAKFYGKYENHSTYGRQLTASTCEVIPEKTKSGLVSYLTSQVSSIGPITANRLFDAFGEELLTVLDRDPERIRSCAFLTSTQSDSIIREWKQANDQRDSSIYLSTLGLSTNQIRSVYTLFGSSLRDAIKEDPYCLLRANGVGFVTADNAARRLGVGVDDLKRVKAVVLHIINELSVSDGHMYVSSQQILDYASKRLFRKGSIEPFSHGEFLSESHFYKVLSDCIESSEIVVDDHRIYSSKNYICEKESAWSVAQFILKPPRNFEDLDKTLTDFEEKNNIKFSEDQRNAYLLLKKSRFLTVTGFPGTGKTTLITAFVDLFEKQNLSYTMMSPTGIAAKRLSQVTNRPASTIHRSFGFKKDGTWEFSPSNKYAVDAIIVDEMSMVDASLFRHLVTSIHQDTILILVGDSAQLPSVGAGHVLQNLIQCPDVPHVSLTQIYRQGKTSDIVAVAHSILKNDLIDTSFNRDSEFVFLPMLQDSVVGELKKLASKLKDGNKNFQVISPMYDGELGVNNLNIKLRSILNPTVIENKSVHIRSGETDIYEGDRVMVIKNDYDRMIFNGDVGKVVRIDIKNDEVDVKIHAWFDQDSNTAKYVDKVMTFKVEEARSMLKVAYACTAHKCQGQEFDYVVMPMTSEYGIMLYRNLVYTAITRAKKKVFLFGDPNSFLHAIGNNRETVRNSNMSTLIHSFHDQSSVASVHDS